MKNLNIIIKKIFEIKKESIPIILPKNIKNWNVNLGKYRNNIYICITYLLIDNYLIFKFLKNKSIVLNGTYDILINYFGKIKNYLINDQIIYYNYQIGEKLKNFTNYSEDDDIILYLIQNSVINHFKYIKSIFYLNPNEILNLFINSNFYHLNLKEISKEKLLKNLELMNEYFKNIKIEKLENEKNDIYKNKENLNRYFFILSNNLIKINENNKINDKFYYPIINFKYENSINYLKIKLFSKFDKNNLFKLGIDNFNLNEKNKTIWLNINDIIDSELKYLFINKYNLNKNHKYFFKLFKINLSNENNSKNEFIHKLKIKQKSVIKIKILFKHLLNYKDLNLNLKYPKIEIILFKLKELDNDIIKSDFLNFSEDNTFYNVNIKYKKEIDNLFYNEYNWELELKKGYYFIHFNIIYNELFNKVKISYKSEIFKKLINIENYLNKSLIDILFFKNFLMNFFNNQNILKLKYSYSIEEQNLLIMFYKILKSVYYIVIIIKSNINLYFKINKYFIKNDLITLSYNFSKIIEINFTKKNLFYLKNVPGICILKVELNTNKIKEFGLDKNYILNNFFTIKSFENDNNLDVEKIELKTKNNEIIENKLKWLHLEHYFKFNNLIKNVYEKYNFESSNINKTNIFINIINKLNNDFNEYKKYYNFLSNIKVSTDKINFNDNFIYYSNKSLLYNYFKKNFKGDSKNIELIEIKEYSLKLNTLINYCIEKIDPLKLLDKNIFQYILNTKKFMIIYIDNKEKEINLEGIIEYKLKNLKIQENENFILNSNDIRFLLKPNNFIFILFIRVNRGKYKYLLNSKIKFK